MTVLIWITGAIVLFVGQELIFMFSAIMGGFLASRFLFLFPASMPYWAGWIFIIVIGLLAGWATTANKDIGFYVAGVLGGGYIASSIVAPNAQGIPILPFIFGAILVALLTGLLKEWGVIIASCLIGIYMLYPVIPLAGTAKTLAATGLFIVGALAQVVLFQMQKHS